MGQFLQWNPNETNQETDAQYLADSQRASGAVNDTPLPAPLGNKAFYQWSTFCAAFGQMMANKPGAYVLDDSSESALAAVLANILTESDTEPNIISVAYSPTPAFNAADSNGFQMALSGNITSSTISGVTAGQLIAFYFAQDSVGGRTVSWPSSFVGVIQPDPTPYAVSVILFRADLTGNPRAVSPMISNNGMFVNALSAQSITLAAGAPVGAVLIGNGTIYAPVANGGFTFGNNGNGYWVIDPTGHIHQWGVVSGTISTGRIIPFAIPFTNAASVVPVASAIITHGSGIGYPSITNGSVTTTQFGVEMGSNPSQGIYWSADGY
jgi:hypothetical protein